MSLSQPLSSTSPTPRRSRQASRSAARQPGITAVPRRQRRQQRHQASALELGTRLVVNSVLGLVAAIALGRILSHHHTQQQALATLEAAIATAETETAVHQADFSRLFDPAFNHPAGPGPHSQTLPILWIDPTP